MIKKMILGSLCLVVVSLSLYGMNKDKKSIHTIQEMQNEYARMRQERAHKGVSSYEQSRKVRIDDADSKPVVKINPQPTIIENK